MSLRTELFSLRSSTSLPQYSELVSLTEKTLSLLENENPSYRPKESSKEKFSGGLLDFTSRQENKPVIVIPDLHGRRYFLMHILDYSVKIGQKNLTILEACEEKLIYLVCVGDIFHSEMRGYQRWKKAFLEFREGNILSKAMTEEMTENLNLLLMVMKLKLACPESFHCLKGNHENILNEEGRGNHPFYKMAQEGEMVYRFMAEYYDDAAIYLLSCFEHSLPLCAIFPNLAVSHAEPSVPLTRRKIINYRKHSDVVLNLTWTGNGNAVSGSVSKSIINLIKKNCRQTVWIGGHRPVNGKYLKRQRGKYIQIHNPDEENIALVRPGVKFNPETDIYSVKPV